MLSRCMFEFYTKCSSLIIVANFYLLTALFENVFIGVIDGKDAAKNEKNSGSSSPQETKHHKRCTCKKTPVK